MRKISQSSSSFFNSYRHQQFICIFNFDDNACQNLLISLKIKVIYNFFFKIAMCINQVRVEMYNSENLNRNPHKSRKIQKLNLELIHKFSDLITIYRGINLSFS